MVRRVIFLVFLGICLTAIAAVAIDSENEQVAVTQPDNQST